jgi:predicted nuclease of predicted toxin-antitoxin system
MKLLLDQNLSFKICGPLSELFPGTTQVRLVGLSDASDRAIWEYAKRNGFYVVSLDSDFSEMSALLEPPRKIIWLRCGNQPTAVIEKLLRSHADVLEQFDMDSASACIEIY